MGRTKGAATTAPMKPAKARYRIWRSMRILRRFTIPQLAATAEAGTQNVVSYVCALTTHGYVRLSARRQLGVPGRNHNVYVLAYDTGPNSPAIGRDGTIFDPNLIKKVMHS